MPEPSPPAPNIDAPRAPTLDSVARHAGVSRQTVSNALNNPSVVRAETLQRVRAAIDVLGYRPFAAARNLRTRRSRTIAMRLHPIRDGVKGIVHDRFVHAVVEAAREHDHRVLLIPLARRADETAAFADAIARGEADAALLTAVERDDPRQAELVRQRVPFVSFGRHWEATGRGPWVDIDGAAGTYQATQHLLLRGHTRIGFLGWPRGSRVGDDRRAGWASALADASVPADPRHELEIVDNTDHARNAIEAVLRLDAPPTALVCASDTLAFGALQAAGLLAPEIAIVGFDDTPTAATVGLTSVAQPLPEAARESVRLLIAVIEGHASAHDERVLIAPLLVPRASTLPRVAK